MFSLITFFFILSSILKQLKTIQIFVQKLSRIFGTLYHMIEI